jgi:hypothetical protein
MYMTYSFWNAQPPSVRILLFGLTVLALISIVRFGRLARYLYRYSGEPILPERIFRGEADPDLVARFALASRGLAFTAFQRGCRL